MPFAVRAENKLVSHRTPSLFQNDFNQMRGYIYHWGNPNMKCEKDGWFFAYELLSEKCLEQKNNRFLEFKSEYAPFVRFILHELLNASPIKQVVFTSDWQFGPKRAERFEPIISAGFWKLHDAFKLRLNSLYYLSENSPRLRASAVKIKP
jgi:hypothetical protein